MTDLLHQAGSHTGRARAAAAACARDAAALPAAYVPRGAAGLRFILRCAIRSTERTDAIHAQGCAAMGVFAALGVLVSLHGLQLAVGSAARQQDPLATILARMHPPDIPARDVRRTSEHSADQCASLDGHYSDHQISLSIRNMHFFGCLPLKILVHCWIRWSCRPPALGTQTPPSTRRLKRATTPAAAVWSCRLAHGCQLGRSS